MSKRTFHLGYMDKDTDERLLPNGVYRHAENIDVINSEGSDVGAVEKNLSNKKLTFFDVGENPIDLGKFEDQKNSKLYWITLSDNGSYLFEWDDKNQAQSIVLADTRPVETKVFNLSKDHQITGIGKVLSQDGKDDLLIITDDNMEPLCINIERAKGYGVNGFQKEDIYLIKKPPSKAPITRLILDNTEANYIEDKFFTFSHRYRYIDGEYSAFSNFSIYNFKQKKFNIDYFECINTGMINAFNAVNIKFNTGDKRVTDIQLIAKQSNSNIPYVVETFNKKDLGWDDDKEEVFNFYNNKIYTPLAEKELYRTFDNVPRKAKALTIVSNIVTFGNYLEGYDLIDVTGKKVVMDYDVTFNSYNNESVYDFTTNIIDTTGVSSDFQVTAPTENIFLEGYNLAIFIKFTIDGTQAYSNGFYFILERDYTDFNDIFNDTQFQSFISAVNQDIANNYEYTLDPSKVIVQDPYIEVSYASGIAHIALYPLIIELAVDPVTTEVIETYFIEEETQISILDASQGLSCKSNRAYQIGVVYKDGFKRATTVLTTPINSIYIPQLYAANTNKLQINIRNNPPSWAKYYALAVKAQPLLYQTIIITQFFQDNKYTWCLLQGDNKDKVKAGDLLIPKTAPNPITQVTYISVLEIRTQEKDFIADNTDLDGNDLIEPSGVYMKIRPQGFSMDMDDIIVHSDSDHDTAGKNNHANIYLDMFSEDVGGSIEELAIPQGTYIEITLHESRKNGSKGYVDRDYHKEFFATTDYDTLEDWFNANIFNAPIKFERRQDPGSFVDMTANIELVRGHFESTPYGNQFIETPGEKQYLHVRSDMDGWGANNDVNLDGDILIRVGLGAYIFETAPKQAEQEIFYETSQEFDIVDGKHTANVQDQDTNIDAIVELDFFNCFSFGNSIESYKIRDSVAGNSLNIDTRPNATSIEPYKAVRRFADWTYSEAYIESSGINGINVFNLSTANFKEGDKQYGSIQILFTRDTDILSIQERKAFRILFGKDLLSTAEGVPVISATPHILGQIIPYLGDNGIGLHPESFAFDAYRAWYYCPDRSTPIRISRDGTTEINNKMTDFFRDLTIEGYGSKKIGGYDPYKKYYFLTSEDPLVPEYNVGCGNIIYKTIKESFTYTFNLNQLYGDIILQYNIINGEVDIQIDYNGTVTIENGLTSTGIITIERDDISVQSVQVTITPVSETAEIELTNLCPTGVPLKIIEVVLCDDSDIGNTIINRISWDNGSPFSRNIIFENSILNNFIENNGVEGVGKFPTNGSDVSLQSYKGILNTAKFIEGNRLGYLVTDQNYDDSDLETILSNATWLTITETPLGADSFLNEGEFTFARPSLDYNLYLIWDYNSGIPVAIDDIFNVLEGSSNNIDLRYNDYNPNNDALTVDIVTSPLYGNLVIEANGSVTYNHTGVDDTNDTFTYRLFDGTNYSNVATVTVIVKTSGGSPVSSLFNISYQGYSGTEGEAACPYLLNTSKYHNGINDNPTLADIVYNDSGMTTPFDGDNKYYALDNGRTIKIDHDGIVLDVWICGAGHA